MWDPTLGGGSGAWMAYRSANGYGTGPLAQGARGGGGDMALAASRDVSCVLKLDDNTFPYDNFAGVDVPVEAFYVTRWMDGGFPTLKKQWKRPDIVAKERSLEYELTIEAYRDYDEADVVRDKIITVEAGATGAVWGSFVWGDGSLYGPAAKGSIIKRGGNLGPARSVQLRFSGTPGRRWGVDAVIFKFIPRRMR